MHQINSCQYEAPSHLTTENSGGMIGEISAVFSTFWTENRRAIDYRRMKGVKK
jgi:hypothetical protein